MIRGSVYAAVVAIVLSLLLHAFGLRVTSGEDRAAPEDHARSDLADVGSTFEDLAETTAASPAPEPAPVPEPPEVTPSAPVTEAPPTTQALVASDDPRDTLAPDTGSVEVVEPDAAEPSGSDEPVSETAPDTAEPAGGEDDTVAEAPVVTPREAEAQAEAPEGTEVDIPDPAETMESEVPPLSTAETVRPVAPAPAPSPSPAIIPEPEVLQPDMSEIAVAPAPETPETLTAEDSEDETGPVVTTSLRPPRERPSRAAAGVREGAQGARPNRTIESPLTSYRRTGIDPFATGRGAARSGATGFSGSRNPGNAISGNYAGQVLVQLNRFPAVDPSVRGTAQVSFGINPDGSVAWVNILSSSGPPNIRRAAAAQVRRAAPFPPTPDGTSQTMVFSYQRR